MLELDFSSILFPPWYFQSSAEVGKTHVKFPKFLSLEILLFLAWKHYIIDKVCILLNFVLLWCSVNFHNIGNFYLKPRVVPLFIGGEKISTPPHTLISQQMWLQLQFYMVALVQKWYRGFWKYLYGYVPILGNVFIKKTRLEQNPVKCIKINIKSLVMTSINVLLKQVSVLDVPIFLGNILHVTLFHLFLFMDLLSKCI